MMRFCGVAFLCLAVFPLLLRAGTAADMKTIRDRMIAALATSPREEDVAKLLLRQNLDGSFSDLNYADTLVNDEWQPQVHLRRLQTMTSAYLSPGKYRHSDMLKKAVLSGVAFWLDHDIKNKNWFWNEIGVPGMLAHISLVFWEDYSIGQKAKSIEIISRAKIGGSGTNSVWLSEIVAIRGLLQQDASLVASAYSRVASEIHVVKQDGPQPDGSFTFHGPLLYSWGYGAYYLHDNVQIATLVGGTQFAFPLDKLQLLAGWTLDGTQWFSRDAGADFGAFGRETARKGKDATILLSIGKNLQGLGVGRDQEIADMIARVDGDPAARPLVGNKQFWRVDMMVHQRPGYYASARMYSKRTKNTEWGNGEALENFYIADGTNVLMKDGKEYFDIFPVWDWQRIPGTTVDLIPDFGPIAGKKPSDAADAFVPNRNKIVHATKETFVGGVSDGMYGVSGGRFMRDALSINKAWFFFDNEYVCLGSGLSCANDDAVITTLNQCYLRGEVTVCDSNGVHTLPRGAHDVQAMSWVLHDHVGYLFSLPVHAEVNNQSQGGSWHRVSTAYPDDPISRNIFKAWIDHGSNPSGAGYAYIVLPNTQASELQAAAREPPELVVSNTADLQAVWNANLRRGGAIFYAAGSVELRPGLKLTVDQPVMLLFAENQGGAAASVANPENKPMTVHLHVDRDGRSADADVALPNGDRAGSSVTQGLTF
jgi:chondroitin AC lyase